MRSGRIVAAGVAALAALLWIVLRESPGEQPRAPLPAAPAQRAQLPAPLPDPPERLPEPAVAQPLPVPSAVATGTPAAAPPRSHVYGRIVDSQGAPVAGLPLNLGSVGEAWADPATYPDIPESQTYGGETDADGRFDFDVPLPGSSWTHLSFRPPMFLQRDGRDFGEAGGRDRDPLHAGDNDLGTLRLQPAGAIEGTVRDERGAPVPHAHLSLERSNLNGYSVNCFADDIGHYLLGGAPEGTQLVSVECDGFGDDRQSVTVQAGRIAQGVDFALRAVKGAPASGRIVDEQGMALAGIEVLAMPMTISRHSVSAVSGPDGRFEIELASPATYRLDVDVEGFDSGNRLQSLTAGMRDVEVVLRRVAPVRLRIVDAVSGLPLERCGAAVNPDDIVIGTYPGGIVEVIPRANSNGLSAAAEGHVPNWSIAVEPGYDQAIPLDADGTYHVALQPEVIATGRVTRNGAGVPHAIVRVQSDLLPPSPEALANDYPYDDDPAPDVDGAAGHLRLLSADEQGRFRIGGLTAGHWLVELAAPQLAPREVRFFIAERETPDLGDIELTPGGSIAGRVAAPAGLRVDGLVVGVDHRFHFDAGDERTAVLDDAGTFRFDFLAPGPHELQVAPRDGVVGKGDGWSVAVEEGRIADALLDLSARIPHRIELLVRVNGAPARGLTIMLDDQARSRFGWFGITDASGLCSGESDATDAAQLIVLGAGCVPPLATIDLLLAPGATTRRELDIAAGRLLVHIDPADLGPSWIRTFTVQPLDGWSDGVSHSVDALQLAEDLFELGPVLPGAWRLSVLGQAEHLSCPIEVRAGETTEAHLPP